MKKKSGGMGGVSSLGDHKVSAWFREWEGGGGRRSIRKNLRGKEGIWLSGAAPRKKDDRLFGRSRRKELKKNILADRRQY